MSAKPIVNLDAFDKNIYNKNSPFFAGSCANKTITLIAVAVLAGFAAGSIYLIVKGLPFGSPKSIGGVVLGGSGAFIAAAFFIGYKYKVSKIQGETKDLFDKIVQLTTLVAYDNVKDAFNKRDVCFPQNPEEIKCFSDREFLNRVQEFLKDKDLDQKADQLLALIQSYPVYYQSYSKKCSNAYKLLASQIDALEEKTKKSTLALKSEKGIILITDILCGIEFNEDLFDALYSHLPEHTKKSVLLRLSRTNGIQFGRALKLTPDFASLIDEIRATPQLFNAKEFTDALVFAFQTTITYAKNSDLETDCAFLSKLYSYFPTDALRVKAFSLNAKEIDGKEVPLQLWAKVIVKTEFAIKRPGELMDALYTDSDKWNSTIEVLKKGLKENALWATTPLKSICKDLKVPSIFSTFVHFFADKSLSEAEKNFVKGLSVIELGELLELDPGFLQIWMEGKEKSIVQVCMSFLKNEPDVKIIKAVFSGLTLEQKLTWIQSKERAAFIEEKSREYWLFCYFRETFDHEWNLNWEISAFESNNYNGKYNFTSKHTQNEFKKTQLHKLQASNLARFSVHYDLYVLWTDILKQENRLEGMKTLFKWAINKRPEVLGLIKAQGILDRTDYIAQMGLIGDYKAPKEEAPKKEKTSSAEPKAKDINPNKIYQALEKLGLNPKEDHKRIVFRKITIAKHPDKHGNDPKAHKEWVETIHPSIELILNYMTENNLEVLPKQT